ncbi:hypothetical protein SNEBB_002013 [Seison nebaliae]|nr:hypothetical protein SNEBB_002013 [Seison nebaliae]
MDNSESISSTLFTYLHLAVVDQLKNELKDDSKILFRLRSIGFQFAKCVLKKLMYHPSFDSELPALRYLCRDFWAYNFGHYIVRLSRGQNKYYLQDDNFYHFRHTFSTNDERDKTTDQYLMEVTCGIISGFFNELDFDCTVAIGGVSYPACQFILTFEKTPNNSSNLDKLEEKLDSVVTFPPNEKPK